MVVVGLRKHLWISSCLCREEKENGYGSENYLVTKWRSFSISTRRLYRKKENKQRKHYTNGSLVSASRHITFSTKKKSKCEDCMSTEAFQWVAFTAKKKNSGGGSEATEALQLLSTPRQHYGRP